MLNFSYRFKRYESEYFSTLHIRIKSDITFYLLPIAKTYEATTFCLTQMLQPHTFLLLTLNCSRANFSASAWFTDDRRFSPK